MLQVADETSNLHKLLVGLTSRSWPHAFELIADDWPYVAAITAGFGTQMGLFTYLRRIIRLLTDQPIPGKMQVRTYPYRVCPDGRGIFGRKGILQA
ncbi:hypothetical protein SY88_14370 [Clostridiales bacterium PH28_bin88]|nr:hypothetical protein SY88_14370 [Clostridiales bacterium PH28_bin88]